MSEGTWVLKLFAPTLLLLPFSVALFFSCPGLLLSSRRRHWRASSCARSLSPLTDSVPAVFFFARLGAERAWVET
jgi:hypothetical protein